MQLFALKITTIYIEDQSVQKKIHVYEPQYNNI
jgi:hypothetical protein